MRIFIILLIFLETLFSSDFNILSFNLHALPPVLARDNPKKRIIKIINDANSYDIIFFQENWIFSKKYLKKISPKFNWYVSKDSGLTTAISKQFFIVRQKNESFKDCSGWLFKASDCFANKGFQHSKIKIDNQILELFNTHLDAGSSKSDISVRELQLNHIIKYIKTYSNSYPLILAGDLNIDYLNKKEIYPLDILKNELKLNQVNWSIDKTIHSEMLDYIFYRNTALVGNVYGVNRELDGFSDHPPIESTFRLDN